MLLKNTIQGGMQVARWFHEHTCDATAVFFITDLMAVGFVMGMQGLGVPHSSGCVCCWF
jgi:DNA-binding LacI/PurR family transcriptional regulator